MSEYGWVIEAGWTVAPELKYWCGCVPTGGGGIQHEWRSDHTKAIRFARERDAKKIARTLIDGESYRVVEHAWTVCAACGGSGDGPSGKCIHTGEIVDGPCPACGGDGVSDMTKNRKSKA